MASSAVPTPLARLPNVLTLGRLALVPVFVALMVKAGDARSWPAGIVFGVAGATDQVDGFLARRWRVESRFGKIADPLADRLMIDAAVNLLGKAATWLLYAGIAFRIATDDATDWPLWLFWTGLGVAVVAAVAYGRTAGEELRR